MSATLTAPRRVARNPRQAPSRPIPQVLLELAYRLHATKVVGIVPPVPKR